MHGDLVSGSRRPREPHLRRAIEISEGVARDQGQLTQVGAGVNAQDRPVEAVGEVYRYDSRKRRRIAPPHGCGWSVARVRRFVGLMAMK